jgi:pimeloyl-ACP methyl ester carboxylesterase
VSCYSTLPGGATLYCTDEGTGEALLFVHGWTCDSSDFLWQLAHFRSRYRIVAPDLRGHGRSTVTAAGYDVRTFARDLVELLDARRIDSCIAVGHSLGGLIASVLAVDYPDRVRGIVCLDPAYGVPEPEAAACRALLGEMRAANGPQRLAHAFAAWEGASTPAYFRELHVRRMLAMPPHVVVETFHQLFTGTHPLACRAHTERLFAGRGFPVLSLHTLDGAERAAWETRGIRHPASRVLHLPLGHWPHQDAPDLVNQLIDQWLDTLAPAATAERPEQMPCTSPT